jgi:hypothetical protein
VSWVEEYRGYQISYERNDRFARIYRHGDFDALNEIVQAERSGSREYLRGEAHRIIDKDIKRVAGL